MRVYPLQNWKCCVPLLEIPHEQPRHLFISVCSSVLELGRGLHGGADQ
jgi:hypothetical protein